MLILGIETSTPRSSVALGGPDGIVASAALGRPRRHGEFLAPAIEFCLAQAGAEVGDLTGVAVGTGPGLYTGLRIGVTTAMSIAAARGLPVVGMSGLDVLAFDHRYVGRLLCPAIDAGRGELFWGFYDRVPGGVQRLTELRLGTPQTLVAEIQGSGRPCLVVGDGAPRHPELFDDADADVAASSRPEAEGLVELAIPRFVREETERAQELRPIYLRQADARIGWRTRGRLQGGEGAA